MIQTIFFDFGNVLAFFDHQRAIRELVKFTDLPAAELMALSLRHVPGRRLRDGADQQLEEYVQGATGYGPARLLRGRIPPSLLRYFLARNQEVCDLIPQLVSRYRVVLASNTVDAHFNRYCADYNDVLRQFHHLVASHHAGPRKPDRRFFEYAHRHAKAEPGACLFVDDVAANIATAEDFGWKGILYQADGTLADKLRDAGIAIGKTE